MGGELDSERCHFEVILENGGGNSRNFGIFQTTAQRLLFESSISRDHPAVEGKLHGWVKYELIWLERWGARSYMEMCVLSLGPGKKFRIFCDKFKEKAKISNNRGSQSNLQRFKKLTITSVPSNLFPI